MKRYWSGAAACLLSVFLLAPNVKAQPASSFSQKLAGHKVALLITDAPDGSELNEPNNHNNPIANKIAEAAAKDKDRDWKIGWNGGNAQHHFMTAVGIARELKRAGADVDMLFIGRAVSWLTMQDPPPNPNSHIPAEAIHGASDAIEKLKALGVTIQAEEGASTRLKLHEKISGRSVKFFGVRDNPGLIQLIADGYQILVF